MYYECQNCWYEWYSNCEIVQIKKCPKCDNENLIND